MKVLLTWYADNHEIRQVQEVLPEGWTVVAPPERPHLSRFETTYQDLAPFAQGTDVIMGWILPDRLLSQTGELKAVIWLHAGCDELDLPLLKRRGIQLANVRGANAIPVAEHAMALMLGLAKRLRMKHQAVVEARWTPGWDPQFSSILLQGKTLTLVGLGQIGTAIARRSKAFEMRVVAVRRHPERQGEHVDEVYGPQSLHAALAQADFTILALPLAKDTNGIIDDEAIDAMKPDHS